MTYPRGLVTIVLQDFWDVGVTKVSAGAFGMQIRGNPEEDSTMVEVSRELGIEWDGTWLELRERPRLTTAGAER